MDDFAWVESASTALTETPRVLSTQFGDGYAQESPDGLNPNPQKWSLRFSGVDNAIATEIVAFLRAHIAQVFGWVPLWETVKIAVVCTTWTRSQPNQWGESDITAEFQQRFVP